MPIPRQETGLSLSRLPLAQAGDLVSYRGNCHCGKNRFEVNLTEIKSAISCNCSLCHKSGYLWAFPEPGDVKYTNGGVETLAGFETEALSHEFCSTCGTGLYGTHKGGPLEGQAGINVRAFLGVNPFKLEEEKADTSAVVPEKPTELPQALIDNTPLAELGGAKIKTYTGSCQCGAVAFAVKTPPLSQVEVKEDNCSICVRRAGISIYPDRDQVIIIGHDNTTTYSFGRRFNLSPFCKTCGVACYGVCVGPPQEVVDRLPEDKRAYVEKLKKVTPLYVRAMNGVEWNEIQIARSDEGTEGYVVPDE
ncbi:Centromere protein V [Cytospora mali]|uniref:Centromere protein V n=1 Tax=Cytospora mali TaxID=578113 RepID=A0A194W6Y4_CYTMA|nr:Centromere protein V [Valsa mali]